MFLCVKWVGRIKDLQDEAAEARAQLLVKDGLLKQARTHISREDTCICSFGYASAPHAQLDTGLDTRQAFWRILRIMDTIITYHNISIS